MTFDVITVGADAHRSGRRAAPTGRIGVEPLLHDAPVDGLGAGDAMPTGDEVHATLAAGRG